MGEGYYDRTDDECGKGRWYGGVMVVMVVEDHYRPGVVEWHSGVSRAVRQEWGWPISARPPFSVTCGLCKHDCIHSHIRRAFNALASVLPPNSRQTDNE